MSSHFQTFLPPEIETVQAIENHPLAGASFVVRDRRVGAEPDESSGHTFSVSHITADEDTAHEFRRLYDNLALHNRTVRDREWVMNHFTDTSIINGVGVASPDPDTTQAQLNHPLNDAFFIVETVPTGEMCVTRIAADRDTAQDFLTIFENTDFNLGYPITFDVRPATWVRERQHDGTIHFAVSALGALGTIA